MATIILFCCARFAVEDIAVTLETNDLEGAQRAIARSDSVIVLIGPNVPDGTSRTLVDAVGNRRGYFLRVNDRDSLVWLRRMIRFALKTR